MIKFSAKSLNNYIERVLIFFKLNSLTAENRIMVNFIEEIKGTIGLNLQFSIFINSSLDFSQLNKAA